jgi:hypothetical protein
MYRSKTLLMLLALAVLPAAAHAAKFTKASASTTDGNIRVTEPPPTIYHGGLLVSFTEVGVPAVSPTTYLVTADATANYVCVNNGDNQPNADNKAGVGGPVSATATFTSSSNGQVIGGIGVPPLGPGAFSCPNGQTPSLSDVSYTNVVITDQTHGVSYNIPGTFSLVLIPLKTK